MVILLAYIVAMFTRYTSNRTCHSHRYIHNNFIVTIIQRFHRILSWSSCSVERGCGCSIGFTYVFSYPANKGWQWLLFLKEGCWILSFQKWFLIYRSKSTIVFTSHRSKCPCPLSASTQVLNFSLSYEFCFEWCESSTDFQVAGLLHGAFRKCPSHFLVVFLEQVKDIPLHLIHSIYGFYFVSESISPSNYSISSLIIIIILWSCFIVSWNK